MSKDSKGVKEFLDSLGPIPSAPNSSKPSGGAATSGVTAQGTTGEAAEALAFLDELTQQSSRPTRVMTPGPRVRNAADSARKSANASPAPSLGKGSSQTIPPSANTTSTTASANAETSKSAETSGGGWGWGSVWSTASAAIAQARTVVDEQVVKNIPNEQAKKWSEGMITYVKQAQLDKIGNDLRAVGMSTISQMINAVAPPIAEHEVVQIWLSHDMRGYEGVESLVYRSMARIMEQVEGGDLVVNRGNESKPKSDPKERNINAIDGLEPAYKLAVAELEGLVNSDILNAPHKESLTKQENPTTYSSVYLRIQPFYSITPPFMTSMTKEESTAPARQLQFFLYLTDPNHSITHSTVSQVIPAEWLEIWDEYEWVEDLVVETLRVAVEIIGEQYLASRMAWGKSSKKAGEKSEKPTESTA